MTKRQNSFWFFNNLSAGKFDSSWGNPAAKTFQLGLGREQHCGIDLKFDLFWSHETFLNDISESSRQWAIPSYSLGWFNLQEIQDLPAKFCVALSKLFGGMQVETNMVQFRSQFRQGELCRCLWCQKSSQIEHWMSFKLSPKFRGEFQNVLQTSLWLRREFWNSPPICGRVLNTWQMDDFSRDSIRVTMAIHVIWIRIGQTCTNIYCSQLHSCLRVVGDWQTCATQVKTCHKSFLFNKLFPKTLPWFRGDF